MNSSKNTTLHNLKSMKPGSLVEAYDCDGRIWERIFWELDGDTAYLSSSDCYERMLNGDTEARPVGFLVSDLVLPHG